MISLSRRVLPAAQILLLLLGDGAKDEEAWLIIVGDGPATLTRVEEAK